MPTHVDLILKEQNHAQRERLAFIDFYLQYRGAVGRSDLMAYFGTAVASSTRDFALYRKLASDNLVLRHDSKRYYRTENFQPLFQHDAFTSLLHLDPGFVEEAPDLIPPPQDVLATLSRAIHLGQALQVDYLSLSSGSSQRMIIPHSIVNNGQRWHLRGYCRKRKAFRDFVCTRITDINVTETTIAAHERQAADAEWNQMLTLELVPHPGHQHPAAIALDFQMSATDTGPVRRLSLHAARAGYLLQHWQVDCSPDHRLPAHQYHLWLRNVAAISNTAYPLSNMVLAPGFTQASTVAADHTTRHQ